MSSTSDHIFANRKTLTVTMAEIKTLLPLDECIELQKQIFVAHARGECVDAPNTWLRMTKQNKWMKLLAGYAGGVEAMGMKVLARFPKNPPGMNIGSIVALFDVNDGFPLAIMDAVYFTAVRTAAGGGLCVPYCARQESESVGILGSGVQAKYNLMAMKQQFPRIRRARVYSRSQERREAYAGKMQAETGVEITPVATVKEAVEGADIILTATNSPEPVLTPDLVRPGVLIAAMGIKTEIHPEVFKGAWVIGDGIQVTCEDGKFSVALAAGTVSESDVNGELGQVILGEIPGRRSEDDIVIFDSSGLAVQDVICAYHVYRKAQQEGKGTWVDLGLGEFP